MKKNSLFALMLCFCATMTMAQSNNANVTQTGDDTTVDIIQTGEEKETD